MSTQSSTTPQIRLIKLREFGKILSWSRTTIWRKSKTDPNFPKKVQPTENGPNYYVESEAHEYARKLVADSRNETA